MVEKTPSNGGCRILKTAPLSRTPFYVLLTNASQIPGTQADGTIDLKEAEGMGSASTHARP